MNVTDAKINERKTDNCKSISVQVQLADWNRGCRTHRVQQILRIRSVNVILLVITVVDCGFISGF